MKLLTAGREQSMQGLLVWPVKLKIGSQWYEEQLYVADIKQDMLLGFDILYNRGSAILDMGQGKLQFDGQEIDLNMKGGSGTSLGVARVTVDKRQVIPPNSVVKINCTMDRELPDYVLEPASLFKVLMRE